MATFPSIAPLLTVDEFLKIRFAADQKAELSNGVIRMMAGGTASHSRVKGNIFAWLYRSLVGSGCRPYDSDMGVRTHDLSLRYPDVSVFCGRNGPENDSVKVFDDPKMIVEVLSPSTKDDDLTVKLPEYRAISSVDTILFVDPESGAMRLLQRTGPKAWTDVDLAPDANADIRLPTFGLTLPNSEIFRRD